MLRRSEQQEERPQKLRSRVWQEHALGHLPGEVTFSRICGTQMSGRSEGACQIKGAACAKVQREDSV